MFGSREQAQISGIVLQPDGRIVVVSSHTVNNDPDFAVTRLKPDGSSDGTSFADADFGAQDTPNTVALQPNGKIVVAGATWQSNLAAGWPSRATTSMARSTRPSAAPAR